MTRVLTLTFLCALAACGRTVLPCEATTCAGCCDTFGVCRPGDDTTECGANARSCVSCARGATCRSGSCEGMAVDGGATRERAVTGLALRPDVMLVIDRSGSLEQPMDATSPRCGTCRGASCPPNCPTRGRVLNAAVSGFLSSVGASARLGVTVFPTDAQCGVVGALKLGVAQTDDASALSMNAATIDALLASLPSFVGGTPTSPALAAALRDPGLVSDPRREHVAILITDGVPNCNPMNVNTCASPQACRCTTGSPAGCAGQLCTLGCLDVDATIQAGATAMQRGVKTIVVGFADVSSNDAKSVLGGLAQAGGSPLRCGAVPSECEPNDTCGGDTCGFRYSRDLTRGLDRAARLIEESGTCRFSLEASVTSSPGFQARIADVMITKGPGWELDGASVVRFKGEACQRLRQGQRASFVVLE